MHEEAQLVKRAKKGDAEAFEELVIAHQKKVFNMALRMTGNYEDALDIVQEAFLKAFRNIKQFEGKALFSTWLYAITVNTVRSWLSKERGRTHREGISLDKEWEGKSGGARIQVPSKEPAVEEAFEKKDIQVRVQNAINSLDLEFREVIVLADIQGFSYREIGDMLSLPMGTVKSRVFRGREKLKDLLCHISGELNGL